MNEPSNSRWALVSRNDGEASVVPLSNVSVLNQEVISESKDSAVIVWHASSQGDSSKNSVIGLNVRGDDASVTEATVVDKGVNGADSLTSFISLSTSHDEDLTNQLSGTVITIAEAAESLSATGAASVDRLKVDVLANENFSFTANEGHENITLHTNDLKEPSHIFHAHANCDHVIRKSGQLNSLESCSGKFLTSNNSETETSYRVDNSGIKKEIDQTPSTEKFLQEQPWEKDEYFYQLKNWTRKLSLSPKGLCEPFEKVEATLHKDVISELGISQENGIFFSLHKQGAARSVRVIETGPNQVVVSGPLTELLASRDLILQEIDRIQGKSEESDSAFLAETATKEVGVMCELIPSPPMARYASSLGLDRSARRYHSVLSRPLSPEPRPQRKKSRRHMLSSPKEKGPEKTKVLRNFSGRCKVQNLRTDPCLIKNERDNEERLTSINHPVDAGVTMTNGTVEMLLNNMKTEPGSNELPLLNDHSEVISINSCDMNEVKSVLPINQSNCVYSVPQFSKDIVERLAGERITFFKERGQGAEFSDKENSSVGIRPMKSGDPESVIDEIDMNKEIERTISMNETRVSQKKSKDASACNSSKEIKYKFSCDICSYKSMRENHFVKHMKLHDKGLALYRCNECSFVSIRASHLRRHQMSHAIQVLRCHICAYTCDDKKLLTKHVRVKHQTPKQQKSVNSVPEIQKIFECDDCEYKTTWQYSFQRHRRTHTSSKMVVNHSCPQCSYKTMRREHFLRHIKNVHQNHRPFLCDICGKAFKRQDALKQHHVTHYQNISSSSSSSGQMGPYGIICHICQKVCRSSAYLKEHMATHSEERSFLCEVCGASFKTRSVQRNHVQTIHRRPRAFTCSACEKKFNTKFALRRHMKQHDLSLDDPEGMPMIAGPYSICSLQPMESVNQADSDCLPSSSINRPIGPAPPTISSSQAPTSAYHITIDGQPAFILPSIDDPHALVEGDSGTVLVDGSTATSSELPSLGGHSGRDNPLSVPVTPNAVHVVEQDPLAVDSSSIMMSPEQYETSRVVGTTPNETANYVASEHTNSTLLYLTANFE